MVIFRTFVISAVGVCKDCSDFILGMCDHKECAKDEKNAIFAVCDAFDFTDCRTCGGEQFKHRNHYSWNWRCACVCGKSKVRTICMALCQRRRIYGDFSGS